MHALGTLMGRVRRYIITQGGGAWAVLIIAAVMAHVFAGVISFGIVAFLLMMVVLIALRGPDDKFTRACQLIDMAMQMVDEDERRLLVAFEMADDETRRGALEAMQRVGEPETADASGD